MPSDPGLTLRPALVQDTDAIATLYLAARTAAVPAIPAPVHPPDDVRRWVRGRFEEPAAEIWVAEQPGEDASRGLPGLLGFLLLEDSWVHSLYVVPDRTGEGIGSALLDVAKAVRPSGLGLWVFESNHGARRFYARHGFTEVRRTDGSDNEEGAPDVELAWRASATVPALRSRVDELDDALAGLLADRVEATAAIQRLKDVPGHPGRDPAREAEIAARMAALAPALGRGRLARIMDVVIAESLDAFEHGPDPGPPPRHANLPGPGGAVS